MMNQYELRLYDMPLLTFTLEGDEGEGLTASILSVDDDKKSLFPLDLQPTDDGIISWLRQRVIPKNRAFVAEILSSLQLSVQNTKGIIDVCKGLSLNDSFWVVPLGFTGKFSQYNLYENRFSEILSLVAYTGVGQAQEAFTTSPELTTNGMLRKAWRFIEHDGIYLYKGGTFGASNAGNEPYAEYYAYQIARAMGLNAVHYDLENWKGTLASKCRLFTDIDTAYVPIGHIVRTGGVRAVMDYYKARGEDFYETVSSMLVFDAVIYNRDRHFGNFGILRDNRSGKILSPAPLFDHGLSLFNFAAKDEISRLDDYAKTLYPAYPDVTFEGLCTRYAGRVQAQQLRRLIGFTFTRHPHINWPDERLTAIERHTQKRVQKLLTLIRHRAKSESDRDER